MPRNVKPSRKESVKRPRPASAPEARENQLIAMAYDLAEEQILEKTASSQTINHFLKLCSMKEQLEKEKLVRENELLRAKVEALESVKKTEELIEEALKAMRSYSGNGDDDDYDEYD